MIYHGRLCKGVERRGDVAEVPDLGVAVVRRVERFQVRVRLQHAHARLAVVILGGAKKVPERELLQEIRDALDAGASGVAMGRNIWGNEDPVRYAAAIAKLIHEDCSVDAALKEMNRLY